MRTPKALHRLDCCGGLRGVYSICCSCGATICANHRVIRGSETFCRTCVAHGRFERRLRPEPAA